MQKTIVDIEGNDRFLGGLVFGDFIFNAAKFDSPLFCELHHDEEVMRKLASDILNYIEAARNGSLEKREHINVFKPIADVASTELILENTMLVLIGECKKCSKDIYGVQLPLKKEVPKFVQGHFALYTPSQYVILINVPENFIDFINIPNVVSVETGTCIDHNKTHYDNVVAMYNALSKDVPWVCRNLEEQKFYDNFFEMKYIWDERSENLEFRVMKDYITCKICGARKLYILPNM